MHDRLVRLLSPAPPAEQGSKPFSAYVDRPNIVLLGEPGAGKSHLFRQFAAPAHPYRARDFLNTDAAVLRGRTSLFIDGLDEKRAGRGDQNTIDAIIGKLWEVKPSQVRISCRAADWLGDTDLAAFRGYFDEAGGVIVLGLERLTHEEQIGVLAAHGVTSPKEFLRQATHRGLEELLTNPQNLIMLADVVRTKSWPTTRGELFRNAIDVLLTEPNPEHARRETGRYVPEELMEPAGAVCAARLIGDVDGISLANTPAGEGLPSYRTVRLCDADRILAALGRRAFVAGPAAETAEYVHRTIAEYLAAQYLANSVRAGLPLGRVRALLGVDGKPASELRGLHAWLAVLLPERILIEADPFGVLSYADAASLSHTNRAHLMHALTQLSRADPWFRSGDWSVSPSIAALSGPDMADAFRTILRDDAAGHSLRSIVLDSLAAGSAIPELLDELERIMLASPLPYSERQDALDALINARPLGPEAVVRAYPKLCSSAVDLRLRAAVLQRMSSTSAAMAPTEVSRLLNDALASDEELIGGAFVRLQDAVPDADLPLVLDQWNPGNSDSELHKHRRNTSDVLLVVDDMLIRYLSCGSAISPDALFRWLEKRCSSREYFSYGRAERLQQALRSNQSVLSAVLDVAIPALIAEGRTWSLHSDLSRLLVGAADDACALAKLVEMMETTEDEARQQAIYETAMGYCFRLGELARPTFEKLFADAETISALQSTRESCCFCRIPEGQTEEREALLRTQLKREARIANNRAAFERDRDAIQSGTNLGWITWLANVYFSRFGDVNPQVSPHQRLVTELGTSSAQLAIEALISLVRSGHISSLTEILELHSKNRYWPWWFGVVAGLDEYVAAGDSLDALPATYLQSAVAIDLLHPTFRREGNVERSFDHEWKKRLLAEKPPLVAETYLAVAKCDLARNSQIINGLHELIHNTAFSTLRAEAAASLLAEFPTASSHTLGEVLPAAMSRHERGDMLALIRMGLAKCHDGAHQDSYCRWLAAALVLDTREFKPIAEQLDDAGRRRLVWALRDISGHRSDDGRPDRKALPETLEYAIALAARCFARAEPPDSGWEGDTNGWDATRYVHSMLNRLAADVSAQSAQALTRLLADQTVRPFHDDIRHALATQHTLRVDAAFQQPSWSATVDALANGPPANIADLHALALTHLTDLGPVIASSNTDIYKRFWNEDSYGKPVAPKPEESCRDALVDYLRPRLQPHDLTVEPEGHMVADKRADIAVARVGMKLVIELKRDYHADVWSAMSQQLDRFYTRDPDAQGYGIYGVFWFGRPQKLRKPPKPFSRPQSASEMLSSLRELVPADRRHSVVPVVIDVSAQAGALKPGA